MSMGMGRVIGRWCQVHHPLWSCFSYKGLKRIEGAVPWFVGKFVGNIVD